jgi:hypothetical protein
MTDIRNMGVANDDERMFGKDNVTSAQNGRR